MLTIAFPVVTASTWPSTASMWLSTRRRADDFDGVETWLQNEGEACHAPCQMLPPGAVAGRPRWPGDEEVAHPKGFCKTSFCGVGLVACCKVGLANEPCDGFVGCAGTQCCTYSHKPPAPPSPPSPLPPSPPGLTLECLGSRVTFAVTATEALGGMRGSSAEVRVRPWQEEMTVVVWMPSQGEFLDVYVPRHLGTTPSARHLLATPPAH